MKKSAISVWMAVAVFGISGSVFAVEGVDVGVSTDFYSKYIWRGQNLNDESVFQPSVSLGAYGFTGSIWGSLDLTNENGEAGDFTELDYSLDYTAALPGIDGVDFSLGVIYYDFPNTAFASTTEVYAGLSFDLPLSPSVTVYHDIDEIDGTYIQFAVGHTIEKVKTFSEECYCDLVFGASVGYGTSNYNDGYFGVDDGGFNDLTLSVSLPVCFPGGWTMAPTLNYAMMLDSDIRSATTNSDNLYGGISISKSF